MLEISVGGNTHRVAVAVSDSEGERVCEGLALNRKYRLRYVTEKGETEKTLRGIRAVEGYLELSSEANTYPDGEVYFRWNHILPYVESWGYLSTGMKRGNIDKFVWNSVRRALRKHPEELNYLNNCIGWYMVTKIGHGEGNQNHDTVVLKDLSKEFINNKAKSVRWKRMKLDQKILEIFKIKQQINMNKTSKWKKVKKIIKKPKNLDLYKADIYSLGLTLYQTACCLKTDKIRYVN